MKQLQTDVTLKLTRKVHESKVTGPDVALQIGVFNNGNDGGELKSAK